MPLVSDTRTFLRVMNPNAAKYASDEDNRAATRARARHFQPAAGRGRKPGRVNKSVDFSVHERPVHGLERRYEQQKRMLRAATEGGVSLSAGDLEYVPFVAYAGGRRTQQPVKRAYAQRKNPRFFDRVAYAQTSNPKAVLQSRRTTGSQQMFERARNAAGAGAAGAAAGLLLGMRGRRGGSLLAAARRGQVKALAPDRRAWRLAAGVGAGSAALGAMPRPAPVQLRYGVPGE